MCRTHGPILHPRQSIQGEHLSAHCTPASQSAHAELGGRLPKKPHDAFPEGWEDVWQQISSALEAVNARDSTEALPTAMFVFVRDMMRYPWSDSYREDPDRVGDVIEKLWAHFHNRESFWATWDLHDSESHTDPRGLFIRVWLQMRCPPGADPLLTAKVHAERIPMTLRFKAPMLDNLDYRRLLSICYHLQKLMSPKPVALPQDRLADVLGKSQQTVSGYLVRAERSGIIKKVARHNFGANLAARYEVATDLFTPVS